LPGTPRLYSNPFYLRTKFTILLLLINGEMHGYQLIKILRKLGLGEVNPGPSTVYPILHNLENEGLIKSLSEKDSKRKKYRITEKGILFLKSRIKVTRQFMAYIQALMDLAETKIDDYPKAISDYNDYNKMIIELKRKLLELKDKIEEAIKGLENELKD